MASSVFRSRQRKTEWLALAVSLLTVLGIGCAATVPGPGGLRSPTGADRPYLLSPLRGYSLAVESSLARRITEAHGALVELGETELAEAEAAALLARNPGLHPASVLAAQVEFLARDYEAALTILEPVVAELPSYSSAQLLLGRSHELLGDLPAAIEAYHALGFDSLALARVEELRERSAEILAHRVDAALASGRTEDAAAMLERLEEWAPDETATLKAAASVAESLGDLPTELEVVRRLSERQPEDLITLERLAGLEVEVGDPSVGLRILQDLTSRFPEDEVLVEKLARAKFRWRLQLLPTEIRLLIREPELPRAGFAALLYWLFPEIRYGRVEQARIVNDVFNHRYREEIVRVANLRVMYVDSDLHKFYPERSLRRREALGSFYRILLQKRPRLACLGDAPNRQLSIESLCRVAAACGLLPEPSDCLPNAVVSGEAAMELSRKTLEQLEIQ